MSNDEKKLKNKKAIEDKLTSLKYNCDNESHLIVNQKKCAKCKEKTCTFVCPADVYNYQEDTKELIIQYENCLECGACRISCPKKAIDWNYPKSGKGIIFKNS